MSYDYRPTTWDEIVGQPTDRIRPLVDGRDTPNFLFYGPPGTGKTATAYVIAKVVQGDEGELMEFNSSDERGIDTVRNKIIPATNQTTLTGAPRVILLDEMESMTKDAQQALRQPMEQSDAIFILSCNEVTTVHDALVSRCHDFEFGEVEASAIRRRLEQLSDEFDAGLTENQLQTAVSFANGDVRKALQRFDQYRRGAVPADDDGPETDSQELESAAQQFLKS